MIFIDAKSKIDKEALRIHAFDTLSSYKEVILKSLENPIWDELHDLISTLQSENEKIALRACESQIIGLPYFISSYLKTSLDSKERFELFVQLKANEIKTDDEEHNYFWAVQIRHDQIVALMRVMERLIHLVDGWIKMEPKLIIGDSEFLKLSDISIEDQIYLEAESVYKERNKILNK